MARLAEFGLLLNPAAAATLVAWWAGMAGAFAQLAGADELVRHLTLVLGMLGSMSPRPRRAFIGFLTAFSSDRRALVRGIQRSRGHAVCALLTGPLAVRRDEAPSSTCLLFRHSPDRYFKPCYRSDSRAHVRIAWRASQRAWLRVACLVVAVSLATAYRPGEADLSPLRGYCRCARMPYCWARRSSSGWPASPCIFMVPATHLVGALDHYEQVTNPLLATRRSSRWPATRCRDRLLAQAVACCAPGPVTCAAVQRWLPYCLHILTRSRVAPA